MSANSDSKVLAIADIWLSLIESCNGISGLPTTAGVRPTECGLILRPLVPVAIDFSSKAND